MGKSRRGNPSTKKRKQRDKDNVAEFNRFKLSESRKQRLLGMGNDELFTLDKGGQTAGADAAEVLAEGECLMVQSSGALKRRGQRAGKQKRSTNRELKRRPAPAPAELSDLWGEEETVVKRPPPANDSDGWIINPRQRKKPRKRLAPPTKALKAVQMPHAGESYNPEYNAHQDLMAQAVADELERRRAADKLYSDLHPEAPPVDPSLVGSESENEAEDAAGEDDQSALSLVRGKRKGKLTRAQRNAQKRHKAHQKQQAKLKQQKKMRSQLSHIKELRKDVLATNSEVEERRERLNQWKAEKEVQSAPLKYGGKVVKEKLDISVALTDDLDGSMLGIKTQCNPVQDRVHNLLRRGIIELGSRKKNRKKKMKFIDRDRNYKVKVAESDSDDDDQ